MSKLVQKLVRVTKNVGKVKKSGFNRHQNYHYSTESDLIEVVRENLLEEGILLTTSVEEVTTTETLAIVKMKHKLIDSESGDSLEMYSQGFGNLTVGKDKAVFAAQTGAFKYMLSKNFMIASEDDPENDIFSESTKKTDAKTFTRSKPTDTTVEYKPDTKEVKVELKGSSTTNITVEVPVAKEGDKPPVTQTKPSFSRRTTSKTEPSFP